VSTSTARPGTLLVVDDNDDNRDVLSRRLRQKGFVVDVAASGPDALEGVARFKPDVALGAAALLKLVAFGLATGLVVGLTEEAFLRGAMQSAITRESGVVLAITLTSLVYAATHFVAGKFRVAPADVNFGTGLDMLAEVLKRFANPAGIIDSFLCLTAVGVLLGVVRALTGNIAACIGLHAGWVAVIYVVRETTAPNRSSPAAWLMGDYDGFIGWMVLAWIVVLGFVLARIYKKGTFASVVYDRP